MKLSRVEGMVQVTGVSGSLESRDGTRVTPDQRVDGVTKVSGGTGGMMGHGGDDESEDRIGSGAW